MNQAIIESCERTKRDLDMIHNNTHQTYSSSVQIPSEVYSVNFYSPPKTQPGLAETIKSTPFFQPNDDSIFRDISTHLILLIVKGNSRERVNTHQYRPTQTKYDSGLDLYSEQPDAQYSEYQRNRSRHPNL